MTKAISVYDQASCGFELRRVAFPEMNTLRIKTKGFSDVGQDIQVFFSFSVQVQRGIFGA